MVTEPLYLVWQIVTMGASSWATCRATTAGAGRASGLHPTMVTGETMARACTVATSCALALQHLGRRRADFTPKTAELSTDQGEAECTDFTPQACRIEEGAEHAAMRVCGPLVNV